MTQLPADVAEKLVEACRAGAERSAEALGHAFAGKYSVSIGELGSFDASSPPAGFDGPGLIVLMLAGEVGLATALPQASGLLPAWCADPSTAEEARLQTLADELASMIAPAGVSIDRSAAIWSEGLAATLADTEAATEATLLPLDLRSADRSGQMSLLWPLATPAAIWPKHLGRSPGASAGGNDSTAEPPETKELDFSRLPHYARSLLKIRVPISVQLASRKEAVQEVIGLAPGSIIKFDKNCDELLQMVVGEQPVAEGEAVKVGEKFGFRVTSMLLPREHFLPLRRRQTSADRKDG